MAVGSERRAESGESALFRADGDARIGGGHLMRCLALAQAMQDAGMRPVLLTAPTAPRFSARWRGEGVDLHLLESEPGSMDDAGETSELARSLNAAWIIVDGYHFDAGYQERLWTCARTVVAPCGTGLQPVNGPAGSRSHTQCASATGGVAPASRECSSATGGRRYGGSERALGRGDVALMVIDDTGHASRYTADVVLNQNLHAVEAMYAERSAWTRLLLGPRYLLLRREFTQYASTAPGTGVAPGGTGAEPVTGPAGSRSHTRCASATGGRRYGGSASALNRSRDGAAYRILVTMGGGDQHNLTELILRAIARMDRTGMETRVLIGGANPHRASLEAFAAASDDGITLIHDATSVPEIMASSDLVVTAGGSTCWEAAFLGLPMLIVIAADNQRGVAAELAEYGAAEVLGEGRTLDEGAVAGAVERLVNDPVRREEMGARGRSLVDGRGAARCVDVLREVHRASGCHR